MTISRTKKESLFSTPLIRFQVAGHEELNAALLEEGERLRSSDAGAEKSNRDGWHSSGNLFSSEVGCVVRVREAASAATMEATRSIGARSDFENMPLKLFAWMNVNPVGGYNAPHTHPGAHWSGVYYVSQPETDNDSAGKIEFLDPRSDLPNWRLLKANCFRLKKRLRPAAGELILFPSYLVHWVYPNASEAERVTIAFNATFKKGKSASADKEDPNE